MTRADAKKFPETALASSVSAAPAGHAPWDHWLVFAGLLVTTFVLSVFPLMDTDLWWHLRTGQLIWHLKAIPYVDWFLFTDSDRPWIDLHWGFQLIVAALYAVGGVNAIILFKAAVLTLMMAIGWSAVGRDLPAWQRALLWVPGLICISGRAYERPEMLSQLFLAMWYWIAFRADSEPKWIWALPAIQLVWINCHALFVLGLVVGACFAADYVVRGVAGGRFGLEPLGPEPTPRRLIYSGGLCLLAALCNPYFEEGALFPLVLYRKFSSEQQLYSTIGEFQQPIDFIGRYGAQAFANFYLLSQMVLLVLAAASFVWLAVKRRTWSVFRLLVFVAFAHLGWKATRNVNIYAISLTIVLIANVAEFRRVPRAAVELPREATSRRARDKRVTRHDRTVPAAEPMMPAGTRRKNYFAAALLLVWTLLTVTGVWGVLAREGKLFGLGERPAWFGHAAMMFAGQPGFPDRAFVAHEGLAGVYDFHNGPQRQVYMDGRLEVASPATYTRYHEILRLMALGDRSWEPELRDASGKLPVVILDTQAGGSLPAILSLQEMTGWRLVYVDPAAVVFLETSQAEQLKLPAIRVSTQRAPGS